MALTINQQPAVLLCLSPTFLEVESTLHLQQAGNGLPWLLLFASIPTNGQVLDIIWPNGRQLFTFSNAPGTDGNTIELTGGTLAQFVQSAAAQMALNYELTTDFTISYSGNHVTLLPRNNAYTIGVALGSGNTAPISIAAPTPTPSVYNTNLFIACRLVVEGEPENTKYQPAAYLSPVDGVVKFQPGPLAYPMLSEYLPVIGGGTNVTPWFKLIAGPCKKVHVEFAEYFSDTLQYNKIGLSDSIFAIRGGVSSYRWANFDGIILPMLSSISEKTISIYQTDYIYFLLKKPDPDVVELLAGYFIDYKYIDANGVLQTDQVFTFISPFNLDTQLGIIEVPVNFTNFVALDERLVTAELTVAVFGYDINNEVVYDSSLSRRYKIEDRSFRDKYILYQNAYGVPEVLRMRGNHTIGVKTTKTEFEAAAPYLSQTHERAISHFNNESLHTYELTTGPVSNSLRLDLLQLVSCKEIYLIDGDGAYTALVIPEEKYALTEVGQDSISLTFKATAAKREQAYTS